PLVRLTVPSACPEPKVRLKEPTNPGVVQATSAPPLYVTVIVPPVAERAPPVEAIWNCPGPLPSERARVELPSPSRTALLFRVRLPVPTPWAGLVRRVPARTEVGPL